LHPDTAKSLGIIDGEWVWIEGVRGRVKRKAKLTRMIHRQMAHALHGWWLPESDGTAPHFYGVWDLNVNQLIPMGQQSSSGFGGAPTKTMLCRIYPVKRPAAAMRSARARCRRARIANSLQATLQRIGDAASRGGE